MALGDVRAERDLRKTPATKLDTLTATIQAPPNTTISTDEMAKQANLTRRVAYMAGNDDFRAARLRAAVACEAYNRLSESATPEERILHWIK